MISFAPPLAVSILIVSILAVAERTIESSEEDDNVHERYRGRPRRDADFTSRMASMFGGGRSGRY